MKKVGIIATGGTISGVGADRLDFINYRTGSLTIDDIVESLPEIKNYAQVETVQLNNFSSCDLTPAHWLTLKAQVEAFLIEREFDGVVITHGTSTLEETAYFLHLTVASSKPIVFVGAQRPFNALGSDAGINMLNAIRVATAEQSSSKGVLVVLNDEINSAREASKTNTYRLETFQPGQFGFLGYVDADGSVQYYRSPTRKHTVHSSFANLISDCLPEVAIVYSYAGAQGDVIQALIKQKKYAGIVVAGTGAGKFSTAEKQALIEAAQQGLVIVRSSRLGNGRVVPLAEYDEYSFIAGDNLLPQKARILLMLALMKTTNLQEIQQMFNEY